MFTRPIISCISPVHIFSLEDTFQYYLLSKLRSSFLSQSFRFEQRKPLTNFLASLCMLHAISISLSFDYGTNTWCRVQVMNLLTVWNNLQNIRMLQIQIYLVPLDQNYLQFVGCRKSGCNNLLLEWRNGVPCLSDILNFLSGPVACARIRHWMPTVTVGHSLQNYGTLTTNTVIDCELCRLSNS